MQGTYLRFYVHENVKHRQQEITRCESIITERTDAVLAKIAPAREKIYDTEVPTQPAWMFGRAAACQS